MQVEMPAPSFVGGDTDSSGDVDLTDPVYLLMFLYQGGDAPLCDDAADGNDDGALDLADAVTVLEYLFRGGDLPPPLPEAPGPDTTLDPLGCEKPIHR